MLAVLRWFILLVLSEEGFSQCFTNTDCTGDEVVVTDRRDCCVGTDDGISFQNGSSCSLCVGMAVVALDFRSSIMIR